MKIDLTLAQPNQKSIHYSLSLSVIFKLRHSLPSSPSLFFPPTLIFPISLPLSLSVCLSVCLCLSACMSVSVSIYLSLFLSPSISLCPSLSPPPLHTTYKQRTHKQVVVSPRQLLCDPSQSCHKLSAITAESVRHEVHTRHKIGDLTALAHIIQSIVTVSSWMRQR